MPKRQEQGEKNLHCNVAVHCMDQVGLSWPPGLGPELNCRLEKNSPKLHCGLLDSKKGRPTFVGSPRRPGRRGAIIDFADRLGREPLGPVSWLATATEWHFERVHFVGGVIEKRGSFGEIGSTASPRLVEL